MSRETNHERTPIHKCYKENKIPRNTTYKGPEGPLQGELQTSAQGDEREHKQMEKLYMFMDRKNQYWENGPKQYRVNTYYQKQLIESILFPSSYHWLSTQN